jgi:hypothetical protein
MRLTIALLLLLVCPSTVWPQAVSATLLGAVTDATGAAIPKAEVTVTETATGAPSDPNTRPPSGWQSPPPLTIRLPIFDD